MLITTLFGAIVAMVLAFLLTVTMHGPLKIEGGLSREVA
jgi:hypothetical protein